MVEVLQIQQQVLEPETGPLPHGGGLGGLEVGEAQGRLILPLGGKPRQRRNHVLEATAQKGQGFLGNQQIAVIGDEATGGAQVDDGPGLGGLLTPGVNGGHHVMAQGGLVLRDGSKIHRVLGGSQFGDLGRSYG